MVNLRPQPALNDAKYAQSNFSFDNIWLSFGWAGVDGYLRMKNKTLHLWQSVLFALTIFVYRFGGLGYVYYIQSMEMVNIYER